MIDRDTRAAIDRLAASLHAAQTAMDALQDAFSEPDKTSLNASLNGATSAEEHLRQHRTGRPAKIDCDPELRDFILARIDTTTYTHLAQAVAEQFAPDRRVGRTAINDWWNKQLRRRGNPFRELPR